MTEPGNPAEGLAVMMRVAAQLAAIYAEYIGRRKAEADRAEATGRTQQAAVLRERLAGERDAARAQVLATIDPRWWDRASREQVAVAWETAHAWAPHDPRLRVAAEWLDREVEARYGVPAAELAADVRAGVDTPGRAERVAEAAEAGAVVGLDVAAERAEERTTLAERLRTEPDTQVLADGRIADAAGVPLPALPDAGPAPAPVGFERAGLDELGAVDLLRAWSPEGWDLPAAREVRAQWVGTAAGEDREAAEAVTLAGRSQRTPPQAAVTTAAVGPSRARHHVPARGPVPELGR